MRLNRLGFALVLACGCDSREATAAAVTTPATASGAASSPPAVALASGGAAAPPAGASGSAAPAKADPSHLVLKGNAIQGGVVFAKIDAKVERVEFPGHRTAVGDDGELPIAFFRNAPPTEKMVIHFKDGSVLEHVFKVEQRTFATEKINGLPEDEVRLDPKAAKANNSAEARIDAVRMKASDKACYKDGFTWPVTGKITSRYGLTRVLNGTDGGIHWGIDIAVPTGTPIKAPACGTVVFLSEGDPLSGSTLVLDHGHGLTSTFLHLSGFTRKVGDEVKQGDVIAKSGQTGRATGAHLDWRMNYFEIRVDPELLAPPMPGK